MKLVLSLLLLVVALSSAANKPSKLLGGDDVDKKAALAEPDVLPEIKRIKKLAKIDKQEVKQMHTRAKALKMEMNAKEKGSADQKALKKQYRELKKSMQAKKSELYQLKSQLREKKRERQAQHGHKNQPRNKGVDQTHERLLIAQKQELDMLRAETTVKPTTTSTDPVTVSNKNQGRKKDQKKNQRKGSKGRKNQRAFLEMPQGDQPAVERSSRGRGHGKRTPCVTDDQCPTGTHCRPNKKGHKHCKGPHGTNKPAGKKCHSSEQCMTGLKCFVSLTTEQAHHKKHPRRGKGICADPDTTDASKGKFLPLKSEVKQ